MESVTNAEWLEKFNKYLKRKYPERSTATHYISDMKIFIKFYKGNLLNVRRQEIDTFIDDQRKQGYAPATIKRRASSLKIFYDFVELELKDPQRENPVNVRNHGGRIPQRLPRDLSNNEVEQFLESVPASRDLALVVLMLYGGLRVEEVVNLTPSSISVPVEDEEAIKLRVMGKGRKERMVYLGRAAYNSISPYLTKKGEESDALFRNHRGEPLSIAGVQWIVRQYAQESGVPVTCHRLRHTCARWLAEGEMPVLSLSRFLGHSSLASTQRYIDGANPQIRRHYQKAMEEASSQKQTSYERPKINFAPSTEPVKVERDYPERFMPPVWFLQMPQWWQDGCMEWVNYKWFHWKQSRRQTHALRNTGQLRSFWQWQLQNGTLTSWDSLNQEDVSAFIDAEMERNIKPKTINSVLDILYSVLRRLHHCGQLDEVPPRPVIVLSDPLPKYLLPDELLRLEEQVRLMAKEDQPPLLYIALYYALAHTGLRIGELLDLKVQDLDLNARRLLVQEGKGRRDRVVYFTETAARALAAYMQTVPHAPGDLVFSLNQKPLSYHQATNRLHRIGRLADIQSLPPLRLRHTYATTLLNNGMTIDVLRQLMGHLDVNTTLIYARLAQSTVEQQYQTAINQIGLDILQNDI